MTPFYVALMIFTFSYTIRFGGSYRIHLFHRKNKSDAATCDEEMCAATVQTMTNGRRKAIIGIGKTFYGLTIARRILNMD